jgi:hypothetical protein
MGGSCSIPEEIVNAYRILVGKSERKRLLVMVLREIGWEIVD